jgi:hypothetical protein
VTGKTCLPVGCGPPQNFRAQLKALKIRSLVGVYTKPRINTSGGLLSHGNTRHCAHRSISSVVPTGGRREAYLLFLVFLPTLAFPFLGSGVGVAPCGSSILYRLTSPSRTYLSRVPLVERAVHSYICDGRNFSFFCLFIDQIKNS